MTGVQLKGAVPSMVEFPVHSHAVRFFSMT